eukprot:4410616-Pleurochrysis_carterae.AAC.1
MDKTPHALRALRMPLDCSLTSAKRAKSKTAISSALALADTAIEFIAGSGEEQNGDLFHAGSTD